MKPALTMPSSGMARQEFELQRVDYAAAEASGRVGGVQAGFPLWLGVWSIGKIGQAKSDELRAFVSQLRGQTRRLLGRDLARPYPFAHITGFAGMTRAGGGSFDGTATSWSEGIDSDGDSNVTLAGLPAALQLSVGDYIGFRWTASEDAVAGMEWNALVRVVEGATASGGGGITVGCEPPIPSAVPDDAVAYLNNPVCTMALLTDQSKLDAIDRRLAVGGGIIAAIQDLRS